DLRSLDYRAKQSSFASTSGPPPSENEDPRPSPRPQRLCRRKEPSVPIRSEQYRLLGTSRLRALADQDSLRRRPLRWERRRRRASREPADDRNSSPERPNERQAWTALAEQSAMDRRARKAVASRIRHELPAPSRSPWSDRSHRARYESSLTSNTSRVF